MCRTSCETSSRVAHRLVALYTLAASSGGPSQGVRRVVEAMMQSPTFLYHGDIGVSGSRSSLVQSRSPSISIAISDSTSSTTKPCSCVGVYGKAVCTQTSSCSGNT